MIMYQTDHFIYYSHDLEQSCVIEARTLLRLGIKLIMLSTVVMISSDLV